LLENGQHHTPAASRARDPDGCRQEISSGETGECLIHAAVQVFGGFADNVGMALAHETLHEGQVARPYSTFVARQPVLTADQKIYGYELFFRDGLKDYVAKDDANPGSRSTLDIAMLTGLDVLCDGQLAFVTCTPDDLRMDRVALLPSAQTVVQISKAGAPDESVVAACQRLKKAGYLIALDDFGMDDPRESLVGLTEIMKVDVSRTPAAQCAALLKRYAGSVCQMLATKVETPREFVAARKAGFHYFQGFFFRKPEFLPTAQMPASRVNYLRLMQAASNPEFDAGAIEKVIKSDPAFCYRLLRYLNSASFGFSNEIHSLRHAITMLGEHEFKRWVRTMATVGAGQGKCGDLLLSGLVRARFCELALPANQAHGTDLFLLGLLSVMDSVLEIPMVRVLESVPVAQEIKAALLGQPSSLRPLYLLVLAMESGDWQAIPALAQQFHLSEGEVAERYWEAMRWARQTSGETGLQ
jgi:c-di-GMP-related signal transduction protein